MDYCCDYGLPVEHPAGQRRRALRGPRRRSPGERPQESVRGRPWYDSFHGGCASAATTTTGEPPKTRGAAMRQLVVSERKVVPESIRASQPRRFSQAVGALDSIGRGLSRLLTRPRLTVAEPLRRGVSHARGGPPVVGRARPSVALPGRRAGTG